MVKEYQDPSLRGRVLKILRDRILTGKYEEREELREAAIGEELGVSRTPVREALRQLELEGLVEIIPNRGAFVRSITKKDVADIYAIRSLLEGLCARWAVEYATKEQVEQMEEVLLLSEFHSKKAGEEKEDQVVSLDGSFHELLYEASGSRILQHVLSDFHKYVQIARKDSVHKKNRAPKSIAEHKAILEAVKRKDADMAQELANEHIRHVVENLRDGEE